MQKMSYSTLLALAIAALLHEAHGGREQDGTISERVSVQEISQPEGEVEGHQAKDDNGEASQGIADVRVKLS